jgi:tetratricopeptide (TPR) repeat protein
MSDLTPLPPRDADLDEAAATLAGRGDHIAVIRLVEAWAGQGSPTLAARLTEARSFFALRLMDRALARAREVLDIEPDLQEALLLQAQVYLERGWPVKARRPLQLLREAGREDLDALWARAQGEPVRPEASAREIEREGNPRAMLTLAEGFLATGSFLRATGILERLRRAEPDNPRVKELLWAIAGDFSAAPSLTAMVQAVGPGRSNIPQDATLEEPEHTESFDLHASDLDLEAAAGTVFPSLFKHAQNAQWAAEPGEDTQSSGLATPSEMAEEQLTSLTDGDSNDTQIMLVLRPGEDRPAAHRRREEAPGGLRETLNLRAWQESMGMSAPSDLPEGPDDRLEEEDENVVVMTRAEPAPASAPIAPSDRPIEVIEKHGVPLAVPAPPEPLVDVLPPPPPPRTSLRPMLLVGALALLAAVAMAFVAIGGLAARSQQDPVRDDLVRALAEEDYTALLTQEGRLEQRMAGGPRASDVTELRGALAEARLTLWSTYNGDPTRIAKVREELEDGARLELHRLSILRAAEAFAREDISGASASLARERPSDDEEQLLFARIAAASGDNTRATAYLDAISASDAPRYRLARAQILAASGDRAGAQALVTAVLDAAPTHASANILAVELAEEEPGRRLARVEHLLASPTGANLPPRLLGRLEVVRARAYLELGSMSEARTAIDSGLAKDGANPDLLYLRAADLASRQELSAALRELSSVVTGRPGAAEAQTALVLVLLDLDRVDEASAAVSQLADAAMLTELTPVLGTLVSVVGRGEKPTTAMLPPQAATPLGQVAVALLTVLDRAPEAMVALDAAITVATNSHDPFIRRLGPRLLAMKALTAGAPAGEEFAKAALAANAEDPSVHVYVARYYEADRRKALAAQHFDRAAQLGPEFGLAWYEKGRFYLDARDGFVRSGAAWRTYLSRSPSGPRAVRANETLGNQ